MSYAEVRRGLLEAWIRTRLRLSDAEEDRLRQHTRELVVATENESWTSVCFLAGQVVEALVRKRLSEVLPHHVVAKTVGLGALRRLADKAGAIPGADAPTGSRAIRSAVLLRNWSAHLTLWSQYPTEQRATQSIALMFSIAASLSPPRPTLDSESDDWREIPPRRVVRTLRHPSFDGTPIGEAIRTDLAEVCRYVVTNGEPFAVLLLNDTLRQRNLAIEPFQRALSEKFPALIANAHRGTDKHLIKIYKMLGRHDLPTHQRVFGILLPIDADILGTWLSTRPPSWVAYYLKVCREVDAGVFSASLARTVVRGAVASNFWSNARKRTNNVGNVSNIVALLPTRLRTELLLQAPRADFLDWIANSEAQIAIRLLADFRESTIRMAPGLQPLFDEVVNAIRQAIMRTPLAKQHYVPHLLSRMHLSETPAGMSLLQTILQRLANEAIADDELEAARRVIWDSYVFSDMLDKDALHAARMVIIGTADRPSWSLCCLLGMLVLAEDEQSVGEVPAGNGIHNMVTIPPEADRWQLFSALLAISRFPRMSLLVNVAELRSRAQAFIEETDGSRSPKSPLLLSLVRTVLANTA